CHYLGLPAHGIGRVTLEHLVSEWPRGKAEGSKREKMFDVIIDCEHIGIGIYRMKPDGRTLEYQQDYIRDRTGTQACRDGETHTPADTPFLPCPFESIRRDGRDVALGVATTASFAHEKMPLDDAN